MLTGSIFEGLLFRFGNPLRQLRRRLAIQFRELKPMD